MASDRARARATRAPVPDSAPPRGNSRAIAAALVVAAISLIVRIAIPPYPIYGADHDDKLMVSLARSILDGAWTSPWNELRLSKGVGYPLFLAALHPFGLAPTVAVHLVLLVAAAVLATVLLRLRGSRVVALVLFALVVLDPSFLGSSGSRVYRDSFIAATALLCVALTALAVHVLTAASSQRWRPLAGVGLALAAGLGAGWLSVTKPDTLLWLSPALVAAALLALPLDRRLRDLLAASPGLVFATVVAAAAGFFGVSDAVACLNLLHEGIFLSDDLGHGAFPEAWRALTSIDAGSARRKVAVTAAERQAAYTVSPTALLLKPWLEGPPNTGWRADSCAELKICDESSAWFPWEIRQAAVAVLHKQTPASKVTAAAFQEFFLAIAREIDQACADGRLRCTRGNTAVGLPAWRSIDWTSPLRGAWPQLRGSLGLAFVARSAFPPAPDRSTAGLWTATVAGVEHTETSPASIPPDGAPWAIVSFLATLYRWASWLLILPAAAGTVAGLATAGTARRIAIAGAGCFVAVAAHMALLGLLSEEGGLANDMYQMDSHPLLVVALLLGTVSALDRFGALGAHRER